MELSDFIGVIWRWKWLVLAIVLVVTGYVAATSVRSQTAYSAEASVIPGLPQIAAGSSAGINIAQAGDRIGATYSELVLTQPVMEKALQKADLNWRPEVLRGMISTSVPKNTPIFNIDVVDSDPGRAQLLANAVADSFVEYIQEASNSSADKVKGVLTKELADIDKQLAVVQPGGTAPDANVARALSDRRQSALKNYETLLSQQANNVDIRVAEHASSATMVGSQSTQKIMIAFIISFAVGTSMAFVADGIRKAVAKTGNPGLEKS